MHHALKIPRYAMKPQVSYSSCGLRLHMDAPPSAESKSLIQKPFSINPPSNIPAFFLLTPALSFLPQASFLPRSIPAPYLSHMSPFFSVLLSPPPPLLPSASHLPPIFILPSSLLPPPCFLSPERTVVRVTLQQGVFRMTLSDL